MANTNLVTTVRGQRRYLIYYDPDVTTQDILLSVSQIIIEPEDWRYDQPRETHYNTIMDESTAGLSSLWDIGIPIYVRPKKTLIRGSLRMKEYALKNYSISPTYDPNNQFIYEWTVTGPATIITSGTVGPGGGIIAGKNISVQFGQAGEVKLNCRISNIKGCYVNTSIKMDVGLFFRRMLIARNRY